MTLRSTGAAGRVHRPLQPASARVVHRVLVPRYLKTGGRWWQNFRGGELGAVRSGALGKTAGEERKTRCLKLDGFKMERFPPIFNSGKNH